MHLCLDTTERWTKQVALAAVSGTLTVLLWGLFRGAQRPVGYKIGREPQMLHTLSFYVLASVGYLGLCYRLLRPLPLALSRPVRALVLFLGSLLYFPGLALVLWGRLALGQMYKVSSSFGAQLYVDHRLVTHGPFALVRHPMYLGILFTGMGGLLLFRTWTFAFVLFHFPALVMRARREEQALAMQFGEQWVEYCRRTPAWIPGDWRRGDCSKGVNDAGNYR